jgi:hypothetical protein
VAELATAAPTQTRAVLPRDLAVFLPLFGIAVHKVTTYPDGHPMLGSAVEAALGHLRLALISRPSLLIGVARQQLLVDGFATDPDNPVLRELAQRLHRHQLGAVKFIPGVTIEEFTDLLRALASDARHDPIGARLADFDEKWESLRLFLPAYDRIEMAGTDGVTRTGDSGAPGQGAANRLWLGLANAALMREGAPELHADPQAIAQALNKMRGNQDRAKKVVSILLGLSRELRLAQGAEAQALSDKLGVLLNHLNSDTLRELATIGADLAQRRRLVADVAMVLPAGATLQLLRAVSDADKGSLPQAMVRMLTKLAFQAEKGSLNIREEADHGLRESVRQLVDRWTLDDPNPAKYTRILERLSRHPSAAQPATVDRSSEAIRLVQMACETDTVGDAVWVAVQELVQEGRATEVVALVEHEAVAEDIREQFWLRLATAANMRILLNNEPRDTPVVELLLSRMGMAAAEPMLESLEVADNRAMRRRLLTRLGQLGPAIGPMLVERLPGAPWFVQRNLLALLSSLDEIPMEFRPAEYIAAEDARVRREALKLMMRVPEMRDDAVIAAVGDEDDGNLRIGLAAALEQCPPAAAGRVRHLLQDPKLPLDLRILAIRVLGSIRTPTTRDWLVSQVLTPGGWFRRRKLVPRNPAMLAMLAALGRSFATDPAAQLALRLASESTDPQVRRAATGAADDS